MQTAVIVVPQIPTQLSAEYRNGLEDSAVNDVGLQRVKERLHVGVLAGGATARHALAHGVGHQARAHASALKLTAAIGVEDQSRIRSSTP